MRFNELNASYLFREMEQQRNISRITFTEQSVRDLFTTINALNELKEKRAILNEYEVEQYEVIDKFADVILPEKVAYDSNIMCQNLKGSNYAQPADEASFGEILDPIGFRRVWVQIAGAKRLSSPVFKRVSTLREEQTVDKFIKRLSVNGSCQPELTPYCPAALNFQPYEGHMYSENSETMLLRWWLETYKNVDSRGTETK